MRINLVLGKHDRSSDTAERCDHANSGSTKLPVWSRRHRCLLLALVAEDELGRARLQHEAGYQANRFRNGYEGDAGVKPARGGRVLAICSDLTFVVPQSISRDLPPRQRAVKFPTATRFDTVWAISCR